jgi:hypothetical protein
MELIRLPNPMLRELRTAWAAGRRIALSLSHRAGGRVEGHIRSVSPTGASVNVNGRLIPMADVLGVHRPLQYIGEDTTWRGRAAFDVEPQRYEPQAERLPNPEGWPVA